MAVAKQSMGELYQSVGNSFHTDRKSAPCRSSYQLAIFGLFRESTFVVVPQNPGFPGMTKKKGAKPQV